MPRRSSSQLSSADSHGFLREVRLERDRIDDFSRYPFSIPAVRALETLALDPAVTFLVGENGSGKSTLIEAISIRAGFNAEGGSKNFHFSERATESELHAYLALVRGTRRERTGFFMRAETMFNLASEIERSNLAAYGWDDLHVKSHGEAFLWLVANRFHRQGLFLLDEPESALSPQRQLSFLRLVHDRVADGGQFIIATHSPLIMAYPGATIYVLDREGIRRVPYEETEHYIVTKTFLEDPALTFRFLFGSGGADGEDDSESEE